MLYKMQYAGYRVVVPDVVVILVLRLNALPDPPTSAGLHVVLHTTLTHQT